MAAPDERPERRSITRERVLAEALRLADAEGAERLSMRKLGRACGVEAMSLYHHVPDKGAVLDGINELVYREMTVPPMPPGTPWRAEVTLLARVTIDTLLAHPGAIPVVATRPAVTPESLRLNERALRVLCDAGFELVEANQVVNTIMAYVIGFALAVAGRSPLAAERLSEEERRSRLDVLPMEDYPLTAKLLRECQLRDRDWQDMFEVGLDAILTGAEAALRTGKPAELPGGHDDAAPREEGRRREWDAPTGRA